MQAELSISNARATECFRSACCTLTRLHGAHCAPGTGRAQLFCAVATSCGGWMWNHLGGRDLQQQQQQQQHACKQSGVISMIGSANGRREQGLWGAAGRAET